MNKREKERERREKLTEEKETAECAGEGGIDEAADGEIQAGIPFGVNIVLRRDDAAFVIRH